VRHGRSPIQRAGAFLLAAAFLAHAGDGLMAALCHPGMDGDGGIALVAHQASTPADHDHLSNHERGPEAEHAHPQSADGVDHDHPSSTDDEGCPFGMASAATCSGGANVPSTISPDRALVTPAGILAVAEPRIAHGVLTASGPFRPPRA
jgi:hypothetical protein